MSFVGSYSVAGPSSSVTISYEYSTLDELLIQLPNNTVNLIEPQDVRDSVYTLWQQIQSVGVIAASAASASAFFQNSNPSTITVGGFTAGTTFATPTDMQTMWNQLLYPYVKPTASLSVSGQTQREYGDVSGSITLNWGVTRNTSTVNIITINVDGTPQLPTGTSQTGTKVTTGTHSWNTSNISETQVFNMTCTDNIPTTFTASAEITWMNKIYWGKIDLSSIDNPNLTLNPGSSSLVATLCTDNVITSLAGAGVLPGWELSTTKSKTYDNIDGGGEYLIFAWPSSVTGATSPSFVVNGMINTAFTNVRTASSLVNDYNFTTNYEVWISNTRQFSPLDITIS